MVFTIDESAIGVFLQARISFICKSDFMRKETALGLGVFLLGVLQTPLLYYYTFGFFIFIIIGIPYLLLGLTLTIFFWGAIRKSSLNRSSKFVLSSLAVIGSVAAIGGFFVDMEEIDWKWRLREREAIVEKIKNGQIKLEGNHTLVQMSNFPSISNGGNEIFVQSHEDGTFTIEFWIDRGFLDNSSQFVYSNNLERQKRFEENILYYNEPRLYRKLKDNWYRLNQEALW